ncbi:MAG: hypothetical protein BWK80_57240 [Desulfobacteraceae bacterium IS3]|nr:MAG: hypothetical protein BWK80_57240 [Desulfobacteraceae bacterium IS3]
MDKKPDTIPFRLTIGVIGHGKIGNEDSDRLRETIKNIIAEIIKKYSELNHPRIEWDIYWPLSKLPLNWGYQRIQEIKSIILFYMSKILPLHRLQRRIPEIKLGILSSIADDVDRLVIEEFFKYDSDTSLKIVLPLEESEYEKSFSNDQKENFKKLKDKANSIIPLREKTLTEEYKKYPEDILDEARKQAYKYADNFIVNHCDLLIDLGYEKNIDSYITDSNHSVYIINPKNPSKFTSVNSETVHRDLLERINTINLQILCSPISQAEVNKKFNDLSAKKDIPVSQNIKSDIKDKLIPYHLIASSQAKKYQNNYRNSGLGVIWLAFFAVFFLSIGVVFFNSHCSVFIFELIALTLILIIFLVNKKAEFHKKWMEYRFLTERLRAAFYLTVCGVHISHHTKKNDSWMSRVFEEIKNRLTKKDIDDNWRIVRDHVKKAWIEDQIVYHKKKADEYEKKNHRLEIIKDIVFFLAMAAAFLHFFVEAKSTLSSLTSAALILPALAAAIEAIQSFMEYKQLSMHSEQMVSELKELKDLFEKALTPEDLENFLNKTDHVMVREVQDWLELVSFAELHKAV